VTVPAYNEAKHVLRTLRSVVQCKYPPEKIQIIAVDDGSADDTWQWIIKADAEYPGRIEAIQRSCNAGNRRAL
jgi:hyaluronan synthase